MFTLEEVRSIPVEKLLEIINAVKEKVKKNQVVIDLFKDYEKNVNEIDLVPMFFADIPVSARTEKAIIYFSYSLLCDGDFEKDDHYMAHELTHFLQQTCNNKPTKGSTENNYLDNKYEKEGFQIQTKYISDTRNDDIAEKYIEKVLDHHEVDDFSDRKKRKKELLKLL